MNRLLRALQVMVGLALLAAGTRADAAPGRAGVRIQTLSSRMASANDNKMDASLRLVVDEARAAAASRQPWRPERSALAQLVSPFWNPPSSSGSEPEAAVFVRLDSPAAAAELVASGARILVQRDELVLARMPISRIEATAGIAAVRAMSLSKQWAPALDSSRVRSRVKDVQSGAGGLPRAYLGDGVLVGVLDSGLDYTHADFRTGSVSRVQGLLDFAVGADGTECRKGQLDSLTCPEIDGPGSHGHGTHVTGIVAGDASVQSKYLGMAPNADILFVKGIRDQQSNGGFGDADIILGVAWMLDKAAAIRKPIAINLSLGSQVGAHDGTSIQEQFLDRFSGPGRIIVAAAGNSGGDFIHASYSVVGSAYATALETGIVLSKEHGLVDLWAPPSSNIHVGLAAYNPSDLTVPVFISNAAGPGQIVQGTATVTAGTAIADIIIDARTTADPNNGARNVVALIQPPTGGGIDPSTLVWSLYTFGTGTFDMWANLGADFLSPSVPGQPDYFVPGDDDKTVGIPGTAKRILCVGSHVTKTQWVDIDGATWTVPSATLDAISTFSSHGPSRDGRVLPNITAPGQEIISALSKDFTPTNDLIAQGGGYQIQQGTSQAAPHVTGIVALMLQRDPALTPENVRTLLQQTATAAGGSVPNNVFGSGRVQALAALQATPDPLNCTVAVADGRVIPCYQLAGEPLSLMAYPNPSEGSMRLSFVIPTRREVHVAVYDITGRRVRTLWDKETEAGVQTSSWRGDDDHGRLLPSGVYFAKIRTAGATRSIRLLLAR